MTADDPAMLRLMVQFGRQVGEPRGGRDLAKYSVCHREGKARDALALVRPKDLA